MIAAKRPKLELLSPEFVAKIVEEAYLLLERQGIFVENAEALDLLAAAGMKVDASAAREMACQTSCSSGSPAR